MPIIEYYDKGELANVKSCSFPLPVGSGGWKQQERAPYAFRLRRISA